MKNTRRPLSLLIVLVVGQALFSCSAIKNTDFSKRRYMDRFHALKYKIMQRSNEDSYAINDKNLFGSVTAPGPISTVPEKNTANNELTDLADEIAIHNTDELTKIQNPVSKNGIDKKQVKKLIRGVIKDNAINNRGYCDVPGIHDDRLLLELILSFLLPPLAVYLHYDSINDFFWIDLILTLLFWIPGVIFALLVVTDTI